MRKRRGRGSPGPKRHQCARVEVWSNHSRDRGSTMNITTYGLDLAKRSFQVHWVEPDTGEVSARRWRGPRGCLFCPPGAGSGSHGSLRLGAPWGRALQGLGHEILIATQFVRPFVKTNKTDIADAEAIWEACQRPG